MRTRGLDDFPFAEELPEEEPAEELEPNGGIAAAVVAAGVGCAALGVVTVAAAAFSSFEPARGEGGTRRGPRNRRNVIAWRERAACGADRPPAASSRQSPRSD
jgi:hypothetical protein